MLYRIATLLTVALLTIATSVVGQPSGCSWLERKPLTNWNRAGASIPKVSNKDSVEVYCKQQIHNPVTPEERAVKAAGWTLSKTRGVTKTSRRVSLVKGQTGFDGMCRPLGYQEFVFVNGVFAGTTSPNLMDSRSDGGLIETNIETPSRLKAQFSRYVKQDPLCCASRTSEVTYRIDIANKKPLVVPIQVRTYANPR